jgi:hypothetical protein
MYVSDVLRSYTPAERRERAWLLLRGGKQAIAGCTDPAIDARLERLDTRAADRGQREADALYKQHEKAQTTLAAAKAAERAARGADRGPAREARKKAEQRVRDTERAIRRAGLTP